jgi:hypothetical protein
VPALVIAAVEYQILQPGRFKLDVGAVLADLQQSAPTAEFELFQFPNLGWRTRYMVCCQGTWRDCELRSTTNAFEC